MVKNYMVWDMAGENFIIKMVVFMMDNGIKIKCMAKVFFNWNNELILYNKGILYYASGKPAY
jgi:hypothetical protein